MVWLGGALVDPAAAALSIDDPGVRFGEGLFETMRAEAGRVALLARHLDRLEASARALELAPMPGRAEMERAVAAVLAAWPGGPARLRLVATPLPTLLVEAVPEAPRPEVPPAVSAVSVRGGWSPGSAIAEHKTLSYAGQRMAQRRAGRAGADHALLLDDRGRLGEASLASVLHVTDGVVATAPAHGLLPGIARGVVMAARPVAERAAEEPEWRGADELIAINAVRGAESIVEVDESPVGDGRPGPVARAIHEILRAAQGES